jgi:chitodextrinase
MRRTPLRPLFALALAVALVVPATVANAGGPGSETLTGVLEKTEVDDLNGRSDHDEWTLRTEDGLTQVEFEDGGSDKLAGATVTVTGTRNGRALHLGSSKPGADLKVLRKARGGGALATYAAEGGTGGTTAAQTMEQAQSVVNKSFAVVLINFSNLKTQPWTKSQVQTALTGSASLKAFYEEESKGRMAITGDVFGWYTIDATTTGCDWRTWHTLGYNAAQAAGANLTSYTNVMFIWPQTNECGFAGVGYVPGSYSYLNGTISVQVMTHEVGHNFGLGHANARSCTVSGSRVWLSSDANCTTQAYADPFSTMGNNALRHNQGSQLGELGWLSSSEKVVGSPGNTYTITPYFSNGGVHLVRIPRGDGTYFDLDFRMTYGVFDTFAAGSPAVSGVTIRLGKGTASPTTTPQGTELLDTTPSTSDLKDAPLLDGRTVTDPVSKISFTTMSMTSSAVTVRVRETVPPSAVSGLAATTSETPSVALSWTAASDNVAVTGYKVWRDGIYLDTVGGTTFTDTGVLTGSPYTYKVAAVDTSSNTGPSSSVSVTTPGDPPPPDLEAPTQPEPLSGTTTTTAVSLSWGAATDDRAVAKYRVSRNGSLLTSTTSTSLTDAPRQPSTTYTYSVAAVDAAGNVGPASTVSLTTKADTSRPSTPQSFRVWHRWSRGYITFRWNPASDNVKVVVYRVYRVGYTGPVATTTSISVRFHTWSGARYYVRAFDAAGNRSYHSNIVKGRS